MEELLYVFGSEEQGKSGRKKRNETKNASTMSSEQNHLIPV